MRNTKKKQAQAKIQDTQTGRHAYAKRRAIKGTGKTNKYKNAYRQAVKQKGRQTDKPRTQTHRRNTDSLTQAKAQNNKTGTQADTGRQADIHPGSKAEILRHRQANIQTEMQKAKDTQTNIQTETKAKPTKKNNPNTKSNWRNTVRQPQGKIKQHNIANKVAGTGRQANIHTGSNTYRKANIHTANGKNLNTPQKSRGDTVRQAQPKRQSTQSGKQAYRH